MTRLRAALAAAVVLAATAPCDALVLCRQKGGHVVARDTCRRKERPLDLAALGPLGLEGAAGTPGTPGTPGTFPLRLVDAANVEVGPILQFLPNGAYVEINRPILGRGVTFAVTPDGFERNTSGAIQYVFYQSSDCSGLPYIVREPGGVIAQVYGDSAYFSAENAFDITHGSYESDEAGAPCIGGSVATGRGTCCTTGSGMTTVQAAVRVALSGLGLTPPFRAEPR